MLSREGGKHLNDAIKSKIVTMKSFSSLTNQEIANECHCSVSKITFWCNAILL